MLSIIIYFIFIYWILLLLFLKKTRHYFFQRFLYFFIIQSLCLAAVIESGSLILVGVLYLKFIWIFIISVYLFFYICQLALSLTKMFPNISTTEWWESFHIYNWCNFWRSVSNSGIINLNNKDWLAEQQTGHIGNTARFVTIVKNFVNFFFYLFFFYLLYSCWSIDLEYLLFSIDLFIYTYFWFFPIVIFLFLFIISFFLKKLKWRYLVLFFSFFVETRVIDKAEFDPNFGFILSLEDLTEYQLYLNHVMYCKSNTSHKRLQDNKQDFDLNTVSNLSRLVWHDVWWDCNSYYFSKLYNTNLFKKYKINKYRKGNIIHIWYQRIRTKKKKLKIKKNLLLRTTP